MREIKEMETARTFLRQLTTEDAENFYVLNLDLEVLKFTGDVPFENQEAAYHFLKVYNQYEKFGVGRLAVIEKRTNAFLGWYGLKFNEETNEYDLGFRFLKEYWNKGFATETAQKCLEYGLHELKINRIVGRAMKENIASVQVLKKIGMEWVKTVVVEGKEWVIYEAVNDLT